MITTPRFATFTKGETSSSIQANMIPITLMCKAKAAIRRFSELTNEKLMFKLRSRILLDLMSKVRYLHLLSDLVIYDITTFIIAWTM
jgi:hypothetical protein